MQYVCLLSYNNNPIFHVTSWSILHNYAYFTIHICVCLLLVFVILSEWLLVDIFQPIFWKICLILHQYEESKLSLFLDSHEHDLINYEDLLRFLSRCKHEKLHSRESMMSAQNQENEINSKHGRLKNIEISFTILRHMVKL